MRFLADECFSGKIIRALRSAGVDVVRSADSCPSANDESVLALAYAQDRILLTEDYDFGELCIRLGLPARGVVIVSVKSLPAVDQGARVLTCLTELGDRLTGAFVTIEAKRVRLRPLPNR
jgi:predicted nuclease of predicted toxin-antitoxin system